MSCKAFMIVGVVGVAAGMALAGPRDGVTAANLPSDSTSPGNALVVGTGTYTARFARIRGSLTHVINATFANEAMVSLSGTGAITSRQAYSVSDVDFFPTTLQLDTFVRLSKPLAVTPGPAVLITTIEATDDGNGPDANWNTLTVTLNDGPPTLGNGLVTDLGPLPSTQQYSLHINAAEVKWLKFTLPAGASVGAGTYLDIDTEGSVLSGGINSNDTYIALYDEDGNVTAYDDDSGSGFLSQLSFGAGTRPAVGNGQPYNGQNGTTLIPGTYYLRVGGYTSSTTPQIGWDFPATGSVPNGTIHLNIRTNAGTPGYCSADFNKDGTLGVQDIFDFLSAWFAGCP